MKILVLGGDGFCGWPTALHLSACGHDVVIVDNLSRRRIDEELGTLPLTPITSINDRLQAWREAGGAEIGYADIDIASDYKSFHNLIASQRPDAVVHLAAQRSVPYSAGSIAGRRYTLGNNLGVTHNLLLALVECCLDAHIVHLGSTGLYGYETLGYRIPEGYAKARFFPGGEGAEEREILHPANPLSVYALTKAQDQLALAYFSKIEGLRITELVQGVVWGTQTAETARDERLINRFDYDVTFGTVINRFTLQAALGHPLTIYGEGGQMRGFIHISDVVRCVQIALNNPPAGGERMKVFNQVAETMRISALAELIARSWPGATITYIGNPRREPAANDLDLANAGLRLLGFAPRLIADGVAGEIQNVALRYAHRHDASKIAPLSEGRSTNGL